MTMSETEWPTASAKTSRVQVRTQDTVFWWHLGGRSFDCAWQERGVCSYGFLKVYFSTYKSPSLVEGCSKGRKRKHKLGKECCRLCCALNNRCSWARPCFQWGSCHQQKDEFFNKSLADAFLCSSPDKSSVKTKEKIKNYLHLQIFFSLTYKCFKGGGRGLRGSEEAIQEESRQGKMGRASNLPRPRDSEPTVRELLQSPRRKVEAASLSYSNVGSREGSLGSSFHPLGPGWKSKSIWGWLSL